MTPPYLKTLKEIEKAGIFTGGLVAVLREESLETARYALWDGTSWHRDYSPPARETGLRGAEEDRLADGREDLEVLGTSLQGAQEWPVEETMDTLSKGSEDTYA